MTSAAANHGNHALTYRHVDEDEDLHAFDFGNVRLWLDANNEVVIVDATPGYTFSVIGEHLTR